MQNNQNNARSRKTWMSTKKKVAVIAYDEMAGKFYESQIRDLFSEVVEPRSYSVSDGSVAKLKRADLYVVSTDAFESSEDAEEFIPLDAEIVEIGVTFTKEALRNLLDVPKGTKALFVNLSEKMVREAITRLSQLGVNHIDFVPFYPGAAPAEGLTMAVTPAERRYVPDTVINVMDIGQRVLDSNTIVEIALKLKLDFLLEDVKFKQYFQSIATNTYSFDEVFSRSVRLESRFEILTELLDEGIIGVNEENQAFACNAKAAEITGVNKMLVIGRSASVSFPFIPFEECHQTMKPIDSRLVKLRGVDIDVTVAPVIRGEEYVGAFATIQRFTEQESKQHSLRIQLLDKGHRAKYRFEDIIGDSDALRKAVAIAGKMAKTTSSILLTGESGTGKELFAQAIHNASNRRDYPFIAINCGAMPDNLLESELFGYEDGAFSGAKKGGKLGLFEFAHRGSIFLDEVEGMSPALQVKLLRVIQEREVMRVGGNRIISIDVRIIAATNERLDELVANGLFRRDLYFRLGTLPIQLPALRERHDDVLLLFNHFRKELGGDFILDVEAEEALRRHRWDGNIRELRNYAEYLTYIDKPMITPEDFPSGFHSQAAPFLPAVSADTGFDAGMLAQMAGNRFQEYIFVLDTLDLGRRSGKTVGRDSILERAGELHMPLSQREVRDALLNLEAMGLAKVSKGRGGSKITGRGIALLKRFEKVREFPQNATGK